MRSRLASLILEQVSAYLIIIIYSEQRFDRDAVRKISAV